MHASHVGRRYSRNRSAKLVLFVLLVLHLGAVGVPAQTRTEPLHSVGLSSYLELGPVEGLTTAWYPAPSATAVPLGAVVRLRVHGGVALWSGAREVERLASRSIAEVRLDREGIHEVSVLFRRQSDDWVEQRTTFEVIDTALRPVSVSGIRVSAEPMVIDEEKPNASSMRYFFQGSSIAQLRPLGPGHYRTSVNRWLTLETRVEPAAFAPLVEWRVNGRPQRHLGSAIRFQTFVAGASAIEVGPPAHPARATLDTYRVKISSEQAVDQADGVPITFHAETDPPGFEDEVTWLASTKYGSCDPLTGKGREFTTRFEGTFGERGRWLGVKADSATVSVDRKQIVTQEIDAGQGGVVVHPRGARLVIPPGALSPGYGSVDRRCWIRLSRGDGSDASSHAPLRHLAGRRRSPGGSRARAELPPPGGGSGEHRLRGA